MNSFTKVKHMLFIFCRTDVIDDFFLTKKRTLVISLFAVQ